MSSHEFLARFAMGLTECGTVIDHRNHCPTIGCGTCIHTRRGDPMPHSHDDLQRAEIHVERLPIGDQYRPRDGPISDPVILRANVQGRGVDVVVSREAVEDYWGLEQHPTWDDLDKMWDVIRATAERLIRNGRFGSERGPDTGRERVIVTSNDVGRAV